MGIATVIGLPCLVIGPIIFACIALVSGIDAARIILVVFCILCSILCCSFIWQTRNIYYIWGSFEKDAVYVKVLFDKVFPIYYDKCKSIGIGVYLHHGISGSEAGIAVCYIFFSYERVDEKYRANINMINNSHRFIKVGYSKRMYEYLQTVLPQYPAYALRHDYELMQRYKREAKEENKKQRRRKKK